jgi:prepilin-type N-terminal cleavage/methylation domain-containing protein
MLTTTAIMPGTQRLRTNKKGFTLTEIAIVLGIIGLILGAIWAAASSVYANLKANQAQQGILAAAQAVRSLFATSAATGIAAGTNTPITSPGMFPVNWQSTTVGRVGNPWHVNPTASYAYVIGNGQQFAVEIDGISDAGCAQLIGFYTAAAASQSGGSVPGLVGSAVSTTAPTAGTAKLGATSGTAAVPAFFAGGPAGCNGGGLNDSVAITFDMSVM